MFKFGARSRACLESADSNLRKILEIALEYSYVDFGITVAFRDKAAQNVAYANGASTKKWPDSVHNTEPSKAVDVICFVKGKATYNMVYYIYLYGLLSGIARSLGLAIRSGIDWDRDGEIMTDQTLQDGCHFELASL